MRAAALKIFEPLQIAASENIPVQAHRMIILLAAAANARLLNAYESRQTYTCFEHEAQAGRSSMESCGYVGVKFSGDCWNVSKRQVFCRRLFSTSLEADDESSPRS